MPCRIIISCGEPASRPPEKHTSIYGSLSGNPPVSRAPVGDGRPITGRVLLLLLLLLLTLLRLAVQRRGEAEMGWGGEVDITYSGACAAVYRCHVSAAYILVLRGADKIDIRPINQQTETASVGEKDATRVTCGRTVTVHRVTGW